MACYDAKSNQRRTSAKGGHSDHASNAKFRPPGPEGRVGRDDCFAIRALADVGSEFAAGLPAVLRTVYRHSSGRLRLGMASYRRITIFR